MSTPSSQIRSGSATGEARRGSAIASRDLRPGESLIVLPANSISTRLRLLAAALNLEAALTAEVRK